MRELKVTCNRCKAVHAIPTDNKPIPPGERWGFLQGWGLFARDVPRNGHADKVPMTVELCPLCASQFLAWVQTWAQTPGNVDKTVEVVITDPMPDGVTLAAHAVKRHGRRRAK
jgi:hypothetical protein